MFEAPEVQATHAAAVLTVAAPPTGDELILKELTVSYSAAPTGGNVQVTDGATLVLDVDVTVAGETSIPLPEEGLRLHRGNALTVTLADGGAAIIGRVNVGYDTAYVGS